MNEGATWSESCELGEELLSDVLRESWKRIVVDRYAQRLREAFRHSEEPAEHEYSSGLLATHEATHK
jgi:hypothetical protein